MIVVDSGALVALMDDSDAHHESMLQIFEASARELIVPWAVIPEVDHFVASRFGERAAEGFRSDLSRGAYLIEWGSTRDLKRAEEIRDRYADLRMGLVDSVVMATAERLQARAIATVDLRDFGAVELVGRPEIWPRDFAT